LVNDPATPYAWAESVYLDWTETTAGVCAVVSDFWSAAFLACALRWHVMQMPPEV
jgi:hypothetical protein